MVVVITHKDHAQQQALVLVVLDLLCFATKELVN
jgi:hypothetical protein